MSEEQVYTGEVIFFNKSYGFISWEKNSEKQADQFVHYTAIVSDAPFKTLKKGQKVTFSLGENKRSQPIAINVKVIA